MRFDYLFNTELTPELEQRIIKETYDYYTENLNPGFVTMKRSAKSDAHGVEWRGEGVYMYNIHGHRFIDCLGGYGVFTLGHRHPHVMRRLKETMERIGMYSQELLNPMQAVLAHAIAERAPGDLQYVYYHSGGAESNDAAIKLARLATGRQVHVSFTNAFHGKTMGALSATNRPVLKKPFHPLVYGFTVAPYNNIDYLDNYITDQVAIRDDRADPGRGRHHRADAGVPARGAPALRRSRRAAARGRGAVRLGPHRLLLHQRALRPRGRHHHNGQSAGRRHVPDQRADRQRQGVLSAANTTGRSSRACWRTRGG